MDSFKDFENSMSSIPSMELENYLKTKAHNHNQFKYYAERYKIKGILTNHCVYLSDGSNWNDTNDKLTFQNCRKGYTNYALCLSYSLSESVAMWMLYSKNDGAMIDYNKDVIKDIINSEEIELGYFEDDIFISVQKLKKEQFTIELCDMIYYGVNPKDNKTYYVKRSGESSYKCLKNTVDNLTCIRKKLPWSYENECRLIVYITSSNIKDKKRSSIVRIKFSEKHLVNLRKRTYDSPNRVQKEFEDSKLKSEINWNLCSGCKGAD